MLSRIRNAILDRLIPPSPACHLPTRGRQVSLPQRGFGICKPPFAGEALRKQFHELRDEVFWQILPEVHDFTQLPIEPMWSLYEAVRYLAARGRLERIPRGTEPHQPVEQTVELSRPHVWGMDTAEVRDRA